MFTVHLIGRLDAKKNFVVDPYLQIVFTAHPHPTPHYPSPTPPPPQHDQQHVEIPSHIPQQFS